MIYGMLAVFIVLFGQSAVGDDQIYETTLLRVKADPERYTGRKLVLEGSIEVSDYYNFSFRGAEESFYSLQFRELNEGKLRIGEYGHLYLSKKGGYGDGVIDQIIQMSEQDESVIARPIAVKVEVIIPEAIYAQDKQWNMFVLRDVQFYDQRKKEWKNWYFEELIAQAKEENQRAMIREATETKALKNWIAENQKVQTAAKWRNWTDSKGKQFKAQYNGINSGNVKLILEDGSAIKLPLAGLSKDEKDWIDKKPWTKAAPKEKKPDIPPKAKSKK